MGPGAAGALPNELWPNAGAAPLDPVEAAAHGLVFAPRAGAAPNAGVAAAGVPPNADGVRVEGVPKAGALVVEAPKGLGLAVPNAGAAGC